MATAYVSGAAELLTIDALRQYRHSLLGFISIYPTLSPIAYTVIYAISTALSIPGGAFLTMVGGFLFPQPLATFCTVTGATIGAVAIFLIANTALGESLKSQADSFLGKMRKEFQEEGASYLLVLRFVPIFPFWLVNLAPAFLGVRLWTFFWTTLIGIIPGAFVFSQAGTGLGAILDSEGPLDLATIFNRDVKIALVALAMVALIPVAVRKWRSRRSR